jgi:hypothetical protein
VRPVGDRRRHRGGTEPEVADQEERRFIIIEGVEVEVRESYDEPQ